MKKQTTNKTRKELIDIISKHVELFDGIGIYFKGCARFGKLDDDERKIREACKRASALAGRIGRGERVTVEIDENLAVAIWDHLNEIALNIEKGGFRRAVLKTRDGLEKAMKRCGVGIPKSSNGRAK